MPWIIPVSYTHLASSAGVEIDLVIRGICSLRVGIPGVSENIHVRSIVGNFLEHSRIFYFYNDGREEVYMGSADWMPRNLERRVEIVFPVNDEDLKKEVIHILQIQLKDNVKARILQPDDSYRRAERRGQKPLNSQEYFCEEAAARISTGETAFTARRFVPRESEE